MVQMAVPAVKMVVSGFAIDAGVNLSACPYAIPMAVQQTVVWLYVGR